MPFGVVAVHPLSDTMDLSIALPTERDRKSMYLERYLCFWKPSPRRQWRGTDYLKPLHRYWMSSLRCLDLCFEIKKSMWYDANKIYQEQPLLVWEIMQEFSPGSTSWTEGTQTENVLEGRSEGKHKCPCPGQVYFVQEGLGLHLQITTLGHPMWLSFLSLRFLSVRHIPGVVL